MNELEYHNELSKCVRCGACKSLCPTYLSALDETMGARGRIAMLVALTENRLPPTKGLSDKIFSCILCEACRDVCPTGINIPEAIYQGRINLKDFYRRGRLLRTILKFFLPRTDTAFSILRPMQKFFYPMLYRTGRLRYMPDIASSPFKEKVYVYKKIKKIGRVAIFVGCSVNYFYPHLGDALLNVLLTKGYEAVILRGEVCCGSPMRSFGLEEEAAQLAKKNIELFNKMRVEAVLSICPTCTMVIKKQYPLLAGDTIEKIMDLNEFFIKNNFIHGLNSVGRVVSYHDPCHLRYGLGIKNEPREILNGIKGIEFIEMQNAGECCGFGGFFSISFKELSKAIGEKKINNIHTASVNTIVTSCPGCVMQLEDLKRETNAQVNPVRKRGWGLKPHHRPIRRDISNGVNIMHIVEVLDEAMHE